MNYCANCGLPMVKEHGLWKTDRYGCPNPRSKFDSAHVLATFKHYYKKLI